MTALHIGIHSADATNVSPFFLMHGWDMNILNLFNEPMKRPRSEDSLIAHRKWIIQKLKDAVNLAQASMVTAQKLYKHYTNSWHQPALKYKIGDKVWLDFWNIQMDRPSKKLDQQYSKFTVLKKVGLHAYCLNTPARIHSVFHTWLLNQQMTTPYLPNPNWLATPCHHRRKWQ